MSPVLLAVSVGFLLVGARNSVPGVNPQHYQQVPVQQQQQYHPPPPQYQQQPQMQQPQQQQQMHMAPGVAPQQYQHQQQNVQYQQQQVPVQQQQQQQHQQPQQQQQHPPQQQQMHQGQPQQQQQQQHHGHHGQQQQVLHGANMQHERAHIQEHMQVPIDTSKMSEQELQFHYFKMHDSDNNNKLDGCELIKSLIHWHGDEKEAPKNTEGEGGAGAKKEQSYTDERLAEIIDYVLKTMDFNMDGYIEYAEYRKSEEAQEGDAPTKN